MHFTDKLNKQTLKPFRATRLHKLLRHAQQGEADSVGFIGYTMVFWFMMLVALMFAMTGFYRIGASYGNELGVRVGAVYGDEAKGRDVTTERFGFFTNDQFACQNACYVELPTSRMASGLISVQSDFSDLIKNPNEPSGLFGPPLKINSQSQVRLERFYPGPAKCTGGDCFE